MSGLGDYREYLPESADIFSFGRAGDLSYLPAPSQDPVGSLLMPRHSVLAETAEASAWTSPMANPFPVEFTLATSFGLLPDRGLVESQNGTASSQDASPYRTATSAGDIATVDGPRIMSIEEATAHPKSTRRAAHLRVFTSLQRAMTLAETLGSRYGSHDTDCTLLVEALRKAVEAHCALKVPTPLQDEKCTPASREESCINCTSKDIPCLRSKRLWDKAMDSGGPTSWTPYGHRMKRGLACLFCQTSRVKCVTSKDARGKSRTSPMTCAPKGTASSSVADDAVLHRRT